MATVLNENDFRCSYHQGMFGHEQMPEHNPSDPNYALLLALDRESEIWAASIHEAGHAVAHVVLGLGLRSVAITATCLRAKDGGLLIGYGGRVESAHTKHRRHVAAIARRDLRACVAEGVATCAGPAAERPWRIRNREPQRLLTATRGDHRQIDDAIAKSFGVRRFAFLRLCWAHAQRAVLLAGVGGNH